jgi:hypothetical protein
MPAVLSTRASAERTDASSSTMATHRFSSGGVRRMGFTMR